MRRLPPRGATERDRDFAINQLIEGRSEATGTVTLTANVTSTTLTSTLINVDSHLILAPKTANASAALATTYHVTTAGTIVITHANNAQVDRTFGYLIVGG